MVIVQVHRFGKEDKAGKKLEKSWKKAGRKLEAGGIAGKKAGRKLNQVDTCAQRKMPL